MICDFPAIYAKICDEIYQCVSVSVYVPVCVRACVCAQLQQFRFLFWNVYPAHSRTLSSFPSAAALSASLSLTSSLTLSLVLYFSHSLSRSSSHSLCVARVMSARNLPRKLAYKNVDGKYLRSSSNSRGSSSNSNSTGNNNNKRSIEQQQQHPTLFDSLYEFGWLALPFACS